MLAARRNKRRDDGRSVAPPWATWDVARRRASSSATGGRRYSAAEGGRRHSAFTIIELIVVISVIVLILAIALPGLSAVSQESRFNAGTHLVSGALTQAYYLALSDVNMVAVRVVPGEWDIGQAAAAQRPGGGQHLVTCSYVGTSAADPTDPNKIQFAEYFQRREKTPALQLPDDIGIAPLEALDNKLPRNIPFDSNGDGTIDGYHTYNNLGKDFVLSGSASAFAVNGALVSQTAGFLQANDFLLTFDPQTGLRGGLPTPARLRAFIPFPYSGQAQGIEADRDNNGKAFQRYNFSGIVVYRREPFVALGDDPQKRQDWLRANGRPYLVHRFGGGLVMGTRTGQ